MEQKKKIIQSMTTYDGFVVGENERLEGDMIYCTKCGEPKIFELPDSKGMALEFPKRVRVICSCQEKELEELERKRIEKKQFEQYQNLQKASLIGERYKNVNFDNTNLIEVSEDFKLAFKRCKKYAENYKECLEQGYGIYLYGNRGGGKTHLMACMINEITKHYVGCLITNFYEITKEIKETFNFATNKCESQFINELANIPFLFIDDIGIERVQVKGEDTFIQEKIYDVINKRYLNNKPTIFSSNFSLSQLISEKGMWERTVDRIAEMSSAVIKIENESYRLKNRKKELPF